MDSYVLSRACWRALRVTGAALVTAWLGITSIDVGYTQGDAGWTSFDLGPRINYSVGTAGSHVLIAGGMTPEGYSDQVDVYDSETHAWSSATLSEARTSPLAVSVGTQLLLVGGNNTTSKPSTSVDIYDSASDSWTAASLPSGLKSWTLGNATAGTHALFAHQNAADIDVYDRTTSSWSLTHPPRLARVGGITAVGRQVLVWGEETGRESLTPTAQADSHSAYGVDIYDTATDGWTPQTGVSWNPCTFLRRSAEVK